MRYINCKGYAQEILDAVKAVPNKKRLVIMTAGDDPASASYVKGKIKDCEYCGVPVTQYRVGDAQHLRWSIEFANAAKDVGGIIVQLPLPEGFDEDEATGNVLITKDVDGFKTGSPFKPCTPEGIVLLLKRELGDLTGQTALIIGRGKLVGRPLMQMLLDENCTVIVAHSGTRDLDGLLGRCDIIVSAAGKPGLVDLKKCRAKVVIDAGVNRNSEGKLCGDCYNFDPDDGSDMRVTPVPGGVGLLTRAMLMKHMGEVSGYAAD